MRVRVESEYAGLLVLVEIEERLADNTVAREGTHHDHATLLIRAQRAVAAALGTVPPIKPFDQDATQPISAEEYQRRLEEVPY